MSETMTTTQAATTARVTPATMRRWCRTGRVQATKNRRVWAIVATSVPGHVEPIGPGYTETHDGTKLVLAHVTRFGARRAAGVVRWQVALISGGFGADVLGPFGTAEDALAAGRRELGVETGQGAPAPRTCTRCTRTATMTASLGPACDHHYDSLAA